MAAWTSLVAMRVERRGCILDILKKKKKKQIIGFPGRLDMGV